MNEKIALKGIRLSQLEDKMEKLGESKYRAKQIFQGIYKDRLTEIDEFTNLSKVFRQKLKEVAELPSLQLNRHLISKDGTQKMTFEVEPGKEIESVWIPTGDDGRKTICISSQIGCTLACAFCATGLLDFKGNLKTWQIVDQVLQVEKLVGEKATNIVFMGMGEPMHNYFSVMNAANIFNDESAFQIGKRRITISTSGVVTGIKRFIEQKEPYNLAISLNHPNPALRSSIMGINDKYPLDRLLEVARLFTKTLNRKVTFEYILIPGVNMGKDNANRLVKIARSVRCKINLIPLNTDFNGWRRPTEEETREFWEMLRPSGVPVTNRKSPGKDIYGACGMLSLRG